MERKLRKINNKDLSKSQKDMLSLALVSRWTNPNPNPIKLLTTTQSSPQQNPNKRSLSFLPNLSSSSLTSASMDPDTEVIIDCPPVFKRYKSGRVERLMGTEFTPASIHPTNGSTVSSKDITINPETSITARLFFPNLFTTPPSTKLPILVYFHGGAFFVGSAFNPSYHNFLTSLVSKANIMAVSINYRLAPEHPLPTAYDDSWEAMQWVLRGGDGEPWLAEHGDLKSVFMAGDSAGANIVHQMALRLNRNEVLGMVLIHPYFWGSEVIGEETRDPTTRSFMEGLWKMACVEEIGHVDHELYNPLMEGRLGGLKCGKVMVMVAGKDVLRERGRVYYEKVKESGWDGEVELHESEEEEHVFHLNKPECDKALALLDKIVAFFNSF
ncbi:Carboxylesterase protein [Dioscorea alata]|uniref:Carboxylesterase protein n=1 Tax=Dioscorea alata TaxID=55571 RepID=A0ACB7U5B2_DIOAL|nr:Carboxylesterase protein [Dioscorea alata]